MTAATTTTTNSTMVDTGETNGNLDTKSKSEKDTIVEREGDENSLLHNESSDINGYHSESGSSGYMNNQGSVKSLESSPVDTQESHNAIDHKQEQQNSEEPEQMRKLFIGGLDYKTSEATMKEHFEKYGDVIDCIVMREPQSKRSRGFGFVIYANSQMVDRAQEARPHEIDGREVQSKRAISREVSIRFDSFNYCETQQIHHKYRLSENRFTMLD